MAFEGLSEKLQGALKKMTGRGRLSERAVREGSLIMHDVAPCDADLPTTEDRAKWAGALPAHIWI